MKYLSIFLLVLSVNAFAQPDGWQQTDVGEGHLVICKQKTKVGIWSNARGEFLEEPHKGHVLHFPEVQFLVDIYPKDQEIKLYHYYKGAVQEFEVENDSISFWINGISGSDWNEKLKEDPIPEGSKDWMGEGSILSKMDGSNGSDGVSKFSFEFNDELLNIYLVNETSYNKELVAIKSVVNPEQDSIMDGYVIYYPRDEVVYRSGVFDTKQGKWVVPSKYFEVNEWEGIYGGYFYVNEDNQHLYKYDAEVYDFYVKDKKLGVIPSEFMDRQEFGFPLELWPFEGEEVWYDYDSIYIYHRGKKGIGMYEIPLRGKTAYYEDYSLEWFNAESRFEVKELFPPEYEYIVMGGNLDYHQSKNDHKNLYILANKGDNLFDVMFISDYRYDHNVPIDTLMTDVEINKFIELVPAKVWFTPKQLAENEELTGFIDHSTFLRYLPENGYLDSSAKLIPNYDIRSGEPEKYYKSKLIGNDRMVVFSYIYEYWDDAVPLKSVENPYEDSVDVEGNLLYYPPDAGKYATGLFDCATSKWIIPPVNIGIWPGNGGYVIERPILDEFRIRRKSVIDFMREDGTYEFKDKSLDEFKKDKYNKYKIYNYKPSEVWNTDPTTDGIVYFKTDEGIGLSSVGSIRGHVKSKPADFVYYQHDGETIIAIDGDTLDLTVYDAIQSDFTRVNYRFPIEAGAGLQIGGYAEKNWDVKWRELYNNTWKPMQFEHFTADSVMYWEVKREDDSKYGTWFYELVPRPELNLNYEFGIPFGSREVGFGTTAYDFKVEVFTDELIYFQHNELPGDDEQHYEIDSLTGEEYWYFTPGIGGICQSGVWNRTKKEWEIPNKYKSIAYLGNNSFLLQLPLWDSIGQIKGYDFFLRKDGKEKQLGLTWNILDPDQFLSIGKINDSLIYINNGYREDADFYPFMDSEGYDSLDVNGNVVYQKRKTGRYESGVYDFIKDEWYIKDNVQEVYFYEEDGEFVVIYFTLDANGFIKEQSFSIYDIEGQPYKENLGKDDLDERYTKKFDYWTLKK